MPKLENFRETRYRRETTLAFLFISLIPPALIILWGELSEFDINLWFMPTVNVPPSFLIFEQAIIGCYYTITPFFLLLSLRSLRSFKTNGLKFVLLVVTSITSFGLLRYLEFLYDTSSPQYPPFGNFYPLAFWSLPFLLTALSVLLLSGGSRK
jgi:hypothetical protein